MGDGSWLGGAVAVSGYPVFPTSFQFYKYSIQLPITFNTEISAPAVAAFPQPFCEGSGSGPRRHQRGFLVRGGRCPDAASLLTFGLRPFHRRFGVNVGAVHSLKA